MVFAQTGPPFPDAAGSAADEEDEGERADDQDAHSLGQLVLLGVVFDHLLDGLY